jgi:hypothetical protein
VPIEFVLNSSSKANLQQISRKTWQGKNLPYERQGEKNQYGFFRLPENCLISLYPASLKKSNV